MDTTQKCQAHSRSGKQCGNFAVKGKRVCKLHGGWSTGPRTEAGRDRIRLARTKHGKYSANATRERVLFRLLMQSYKQELKAVGKTLK